MEPERESFGASAATPSTARTARMNVMRHAASSQQSLAALRERPTSSSASACVILSELESHLSEAGAKTARWRGVSEATPWRQSAFGARSTPEWVHVQALRSELGELEHESVHGAVAASQHRAPGMLDGYRLGLRG